MNRGLVPDWIGFVRQSIGCGWKLSSTLIKLETAIGDVYGPEYLVEWQKRMSKFLPEKFKRELSTV